jgi:ABC-type transporter Mla subunit MlaD
VILGVVIVAGVLIWNSGDSELIIFGKSPPYQHYLQVTAPSAFESIPGERVTEGGIGVGTIVKTNVTKNAQAHLVLGIENDAWPVPKGSVFELRMGGTIKFTDRFISITKPASDSRGMYVDDESIPDSDFIVPVEYDTLFNVFNKPTRSSLHLLLDDLGPTVLRAAPPFRAALDVASPAVDQAVAVVQDLSYNQQALSTLVRSTANVSDAVAASDPGVRALITGAAETFGSLADESGELQHVISSAPAAFTDATRTLDHARGTLTSVARLADRIQPGVSQLHELAAPLDGTLHEVATIEPAAVRTLTTVVHAAPALETLLGHARTQLLPPLTSTAEQAAKELDCIRPYTPEIISFFTGWGAFFGDGISNPHVNILHAIVNLLPIPNTTPLDSEQVHQILPQMSIDFPQTPGEEWNQPWYQPQCGITANDSTPADDSEAHTFDPNDTKIIPYGPTTSPNFGSGNAR